MTQLPWLESYTGQSTNELLALEGTYRSDSIAVRFDEALGQKWARVGPDALTEPEHVVMTVEAVERAVNMDGYWGLFANEAEYVPMVVEALEAIGADVAAELTRQAIAELDVREPLTPEAIEAAIARDAEARAERLDQFDRTYFERVGDLSELLLAYIRAHRDEITLP
jgi:hypothetical protein